MQDRHRPAGGTATLDVEACSLLARAASLLAEGDDDCVSQTLDLLVEELGLRSAVLRDAPGGDVLGLAGDVVHAVPVAHLRAVGPRAVVELPVHSRGTTAALTVVGSRPSSLPVLRAAAAVLGLVLHREPPARLPLTLLDAADVAADAAADALHDGPVQQLVVARYAADAAVRVTAGCSEALTVRDAVQASLVALRRSLWLLRPRGAGPDQLSAVLPQLSSQLQEAGRPGLLLDVDADACARLAPRAASVCYRLVQEVAGREGGHATAVRVRSARDTVRFEVDGDVEVVTGAAHLWTARARALGADLSLPGGGRVVLHLPVAPLTRSSDEPRPLT